PALKEARNARLERHGNFTLVRDRIEAPGVLAGLMAENRPAHVVHLAAQAGVRHSIEAPREYVDANLVGTFELLEAARAHPPEKLLLASTSSVYGANTDLPYDERDRADHPVSFYAATKKATEAMAHSYAHLYDLPTIMFRFFTVYGPWGRPDMAYFKFVKAILEGRKIDIYNHGRMQRDFTYIDDLIEAIWRLGEIPLTRPDPDDARKGNDTISPVAPFRIVNIGKSSPDALINFVEEIERALGRTAKKNFMDMQPGDVPDTHSATHTLKALTGYEARTPLSEGIPEFVSWYRSYYGI
ncbi:MAG: NAD-dependent epimerase/dehydratase family protein, partial [Silicimonas sp.]|nr:NAD-dependent epimerase/dehydratase family protein [Silicimonas sp.]